MEDHTIYRPPGEAWSLILRVANGCPWNKCTFCGMYRGVPYRPLKREEWMANLEEEVAVYPDARRVFLADGDVMAFRTEQLTEIIGEVRARLSKLTRVNLYANGYSILRKDKEELEKLRSLGLHTLYMGLESGNDEILKAAHKRETADEMIEAAHLAASCGLRMSVMVLAGLGGRERSAEHVAGTIEVLNRMQPRLLSVLSVVPVPDTELFDQVSRGDFRELSQAETVREIRDLVAGLELKRTVFRATHVSNAVPLEGRFPADKAALLAQLDMVLEAGVLCDTGPGRAPRAL